MSHSPLRVVLVGFGQIGAGYADDARMAAYFPYTTHAQVIAAHPAFTLEAVVDPRASALETARERWGVPIVAHDVSELGGRVDFDVAVLATPPAVRLDALRHLPGICSALIEKPLGSCAADAEEVLAYCRRRSIAVQVNFVRRADELLRSLAAGRLRELIGRPQAVFGVYGNGVANNGSHMVDLVRMLASEVVSVQALHGCDLRSSDPGIAFALRLAEGAVATFQPLQFEHFRENGIDIWGEDGRMSILQEGLGVQVYPRRQNRSTTGAWEIASDEPTTLPTTSGRAFYRMYDNIADVIAGRAMPFSPGESALQTARVIDAVIESARAQGAPVALEGVPAQLH